MEYSAQNLRRLERWAWSRFWYRGLLLEAIVQQRVSPIGERDLAMIRLTTSDVQAEMLERSRAKCESRPDLRHHQRAAAYIRTREVRVLLQGYHSSSLLACFFRGCQRVAAASRQTPCRPPGIVTTYLRAFFSVPLCCCDINLTNRLLKGDSNHLTCFTS